MKEKPKTFHCLHCGTFCWNIHKKINPMYCSRRCRNLHRQGMAENKFICETCGSSFTRKRSAQCKRNPMKYCSKDCYWKWIRSSSNPRSCLNHSENHPHYVSVSVSDGRRVRRCRYVMEQHLGRSLLPGEEVHHVNGLKADDRIENLELWSASHPKGQRVLDKISWAIKFLTDRGYKVKS